MKILLAHNYYQEAGGEDRCFEGEAELLRENGHDVIVYSVHNDQIKNMNSIQVSLSSVWNKSSYNKLSDLIQEAKPSIVHFHNTFPLISPSGFHAAKRHGAAVVMTLHNYRLICPASNLLRAGQLCEDCIGKAVPWPGIAHGCYRNSRSASATVALSLSAHRLLGTWRNQIDAFIALTEFSRRKFIEGGLPQELIAIKPNFLDPDPGPGRADEGYALYVGRLSPEKGIDTLLSAWAELSDKIKLIVAGSGPLSSRVAEAAERSPSIEFVGQKSAEQVMNLMAGAAFLVMPSCWYETFGLVIIEAFANSKPVIASGMGAMAELVEDGRTGLHFAPLDKADLAAKVTWAVEHPKEMAAMGRNARGIYLGRFTAAQNYDRQMEIYESALSSARSS